ncbi:MAG: RNA polymerase sigma factor [Planctomycetota bacterium]
MHRASLGDRAARETLAQRLARVPELVRACHARMRRPLPPDDVDEAVQDVSLAVWSRLGEFRGTARLETWIYGIARLAILTRLQGLRRERQRVEHSEAGDAALQSTPEPQRPGDGTMRRRVDAGLMAMGGTVATIVRRRHVDGDSFCEIGRDLHLPESTVKSRYYRSLPRLRRVLGSAWTDLLDPPEAG